MRGDVGKRRKPQTTPPTRNSPPSGVTATTTVRDTLKPAAFLIGQAVRERRLALGLSQVELAVRAGMTQPALSRPEAGRVVPTIPLLERISAALDADLIVQLAPHAA